MNELLKTEHMTAKEVWRLLREKADISMSYPTVTRYLRAQFDFSGVAASERLEAELGNQA
jgi:hypothetical protein